jgi:hypothetical protein
MLFGCLLKMQLNFTMSLAFGFVHEIHVEIRAPEAFIFITLYWGYPTMMYRLE